MKTKHVFPFLISGAIFSIFFFFQGTATAAEGSAGWRSTYDLIMKWVNFSILLFILIKYARRPLKNFLFECKADLEEEIHSLEKQKEAISKEVNQAQRSLEESTDALAALKARILKEGERERARIIQDARTQAQAMIEGSRRKIENQMRQATQELVSATVDAAVALALQRLPETLTPEDHQRWIDRFTAAAPPE